MELSNEILDTIDVNDDKDVMEVIKHAITEENIIVESETTEETEIEEIIEIIEEIEEDKEESSQGDIIFTENKNEKVKSEMEVYAFDEDSSIFKTQSKYEKKDRYDKSSNKQVIAYDVDEDWQDEDMEEEEEYELRFENCSTSNNSTESLQRLPNDDKKYVNNQTVSLPLQTSRSEPRDSVEFSDKAEKSKLSLEFKNNVNNDENIDNNISHEIVKNVENNLLYTVLGTKKQSAVKTFQSDKLSDAHYIKMEQLDENTIPVGGTIYYDADNIETLYVAQTVDDNEQYYDTAAMENEEQIWETTNADTNQNQEKENSQDQIFLHEDEDGQLYFKDETGILQPVYLTEDGHYAIAENSDDYESRLSQMKYEQNARQVEEESYSVPDSELKSTHNNKQNSVMSATDLDNEDNTVTISLIISEDEHGQKRTQVIIPTTDNLKCDICNKSFKTSFQLLRHNRLKHAREEDITTRNFPCDLCPKRYPDQNSLARHRKTHTGDRPFQCLECHKNFPTSTALRRHLTLHNSQSRPLPCIYCGRRFVDKASLVKHEQSHLAGDQRTHTCDQGANEEILSCDVCGITYKFMSSLTRHMVTTHMNPEKLRQQAEEQRKKRENNYRRYLENRKMYETQHSGGYGAKRNYHNTRILSNDEAA
ncbi:uncharacterized protein LOC122527717 isoform X3 [Frieseomelitta varia]|uniref:uncharacterized protein LOC122527717 isoform X3 n=1 Tax=Frieseomelitta varia TaxID=561572 RepID=UPI001CB69A5E|nr:uncharacterized protein LOC122527717 isoform X3 [Frieseomelitta varia]